MSEDRIFLDTNILVHAFDRSDERRNRVARGLLERAFTSRDCWISVQVLREFYVVVTRKVAHPLTADVAGEIVRDLAQIPVVEETNDLVLAGINVHRRNGISPWDGLIVASAVASRCAVLLSEDMNHGQTLDGVRIQNPFLN